MLVEPQQGLARAAEFRDFSEDGHDRLLNAPIRILLEPVVNLHEADRCADDQFAAPRFLVTRRERALAQKVELVLVETALEAEQQSVVPLSRA